MKQLLVLSGKGGTGKTTIASSFIHLSKVKQFADCDVEAPNLHMMYKRGKHTTRPYHGLAKAYINPELCINCGKCYEHCRFNAIEHNEDAYHVNPYKCEGCKVCGYVCPVDAIDYKEGVDGQIDLYEDDYVFSTGRLKMGSGNSGLLVTEVKKQLSKDEDLTIIDGPPGIGCPVIASMSGVDFILVVTEPSMSGYSDLKRIVQTIKRARIKCGVCINKYDINQDMTKRIKSYTLEENIPYMGEITYDQAVSDCINQGKQIVDTDELVGKEIKSIYKKVMEYVKE